MSMVAQWYHFVVANLTIKQIPKELVDRIKAEAESNGRSMNKEIIDCLEGSYPSVSRRTAEEDIAAAKALWESIGAPQLRPYDPAWKREGMK